MVEFMRMESDTKYIPDARFSHVLFLMSLEEAGLKFDKNDLKLFEWKLLSEFKTALKNIHIKEAKWQAKY